MNILFTGIREKSRVVSTVQTNKEQANGVENVPNYSFEHVQGMVYWSPAFYYKILLMTLIQGNP
jgi:hypothetical protein